MKLTSMTTYEMLTILKEGLNFKKKKTKEILKDFNNPNYFKAEKQLEIINDQLFEIQSLIREIRK